MNHARGSEAPWFRLLAVVFAMIALSIAALIPMTNQAEASPASHSLTIINAAKPGGKNLYICENWTASTSTSSSACGGKQGILYPGQNSRAKYGIADFDGIRVDAGWSLKRTEGSPDPTVSGCRASTFWRKVSPDAIDPGENETNFYLWNCPAY